MDNELLKYYALRRETSLGAVAGGYLLCKHFRNSAQIRIEGIVEFKVLFHLNVRLF